MYSNRSEHSHRRQYSDRSSRHWDGYDDRREERREPHRDTTQNSYHKYGGDGHSSAERTSRSREYSHSPKRLYSNDLLNRERSRKSPERSRKSPARRRMSSSDWGASEKKRRRFIENDEDDYRYRREPEDKTNRPSPESFSRSHLAKDFKHTPPQEEDFKYRKTTQDSRSRYRQEEFTYRPPHDDLTCRWLSGHYKDKDGHERIRDRSQEERRSQDRSSKSYANPRERNDSPSTDREDHHRNRTRFPLNGSSRQSLSDQSAAGPEQRKSAKGFQRFLDVLNKGVNVAMLTKIVAQSPAEVDDRPHSPASFMDTADRPAWSPGCAGGQHGGHQNTSLWGESEGSQRLASPQPRPRSFSPQGRSLSDEMSLQRGDGELSYFSTNSRSGSPPVVGEKIPPTPEDEHKHRQMQDVLQAIGMNLGFEELGQMSHRIQERLYGKKDSDRNRHRRGSRERDTRRLVLPRLQSRSSSSRSSLSPSTVEYPMKNDADSAQGDVTEVHQVQVHEADEYGQNSSSPLQDSEKSEAYSQENLVVVYTSPEPPPAPAMPMYPPVNCSALPYPALPPALPPPLPPVLPPYLSQVGPRLLLPRRPPLLPVPCLPPLNLFPTVLAQTRHLLPRHILHPQPPFFNLPNVHAVPPLNVSKSKAVSRPRCLQVVETKQPG